MSSVGRKKRKPLSKVTQQTQLPFRQSLLEGRAVGEAAGPWGARGRRCEFDHARQLGKAAVLDLAHELAGLLVELFRAIGRPQRLEQ
eukprot:scaffold87176_cov60-Phaeocystis_antarctica.AAC.2